VSRDGGRHWGEFHNLGPFGEISLLLLADRKTLLACLKKHPSRVTHITRSEDGGLTWDSARPLGVQGKNAVMHLSPSGIPLILCSPVEEGENRPGYVFYSPDGGRTFRKGVRLIEPIPPRFAMAYGVGAANLPGGKMFVTFYGYDPNKRETGDSPWTTTTSYLAMNIVEETAR